jgi:hypothetical protein
LLQNLFNQNLNEKIIVNKVAGDKTKELGYIKIITTSAAQQMSIVFEEAN